MKRIVTLMLAAGLILGAAAPKAEAVELKVDGALAIIGEYNDNINYKQNADTPFTVSQRMDLNLRMIASESVSATLRLRTQTSNWGELGSGYAIGSQGWKTGVNVGVHLAYLDWIVPNSSIRVRMGLMPATDYSHVFTFNGAINAFPATGITVAGSFNENIGYALAWQRPLYSLPIAANANTGVEYRHASSMDVFSLSLPMKFDAFSVTPWAKFALLGENANYGYSPSGSAIDMTGGLASFLFPLTNNFFSGSTPTKLNSNGSAFWLGVTSKLVAFEPFTWALDLTYGSVDNSLNHDPITTGFYTGQSFKNAGDRSGWLVSTKLDYKFNFGKLNFIAWYGSGDDNNIYNGSERMPSYGPSFNPAVALASGAAQDLLFSGGRSVNNTNNMASPAGTWGFGLGLGQVSFFDGLTHALWAMYTQGTNSHAFIEDNAYTTITPNKYLTSKDSVIQFGLSNTYQIYKELAVNLQVAYAIQDFSKSTWKSLGTEGENPAYKFGNAFNTELSFFYMF